MIPRILILLGLCALVIVIALALTDPAHGAGRPKPACVGVVVRVIEPGVQIVRQDNGKLCQRSAPKHSSAPKRVTR